MIQELLIDKVVAVVRASSTDEAIDMVRACMEGGIKAIEITFTVPQADQVIKRLHQEFGSSIHLGAGTVTNKATCEIAISAGATYIVSPGFDVDTAVFCQEQNIPYIPGCLTPTEVMAAMNHGCSIVKLFPGGSVEPSYIKSLKGPFPQIQVMVTGGVNVENVQEWFNAGASAVGVGGALTKGSHEDIVNKAKAFMEAVKDVK